MWSFNYQGRKTSMTRTLLLVLLITSNLSLQTRHLLPPIPSLFPLDHEESRESHDDGYGFFPSPHPFHWWFAGPPRLSQCHQVPLKIQSPDTVMTRSRRSSTVTSSTVSPHSVENDSLLDDLEANLTNNDNALTLNESLLSPRKFTLATIIKRHCCCFIPEAVWACAGCLCLALYCLAYSLAYRIMELFNSAPNNKTWEFKWFMIYV